MIHILIKCITVIQYKFRKQVQDNTLPNTLISPVPGFGKCEYTTGTISPVKIRIVLLNQPQICSNVNIPSFQLFYCNIKHDIFTINMQPWI